MLKKSIGWHSRLILVMLATISLHVSYAQFTMQQKKPPPTYKGNLDAVVSVKYGAIMLSKKVKGQFLMTGDHEWTQYGGDSNVIWRELVRKDNGILLVDNTGEKQVELDLAEMQVNKVGKGSGTSIMHGIKEVKEGVLPGEQPNTEMANQPGTDINNPTSPSFTQSPVKEAEIIPDIPEMKETPVFHAILIAENNYADKGFNSLPGTVRDMRKLYNLLTTSYSFLPGNTDTLVNASREKILSTLNAKTKKLTENDNLFIFYAGHGWVKPIADAGSKEEGFLIPCDAVKDDEITFINSDDI
nr:caspase family protein [Ferruginibacter sp.]